MTVGQFVTAGNYKDFEHIGRKIVQAVDMDPATVFETALPGYLQRLFDNVGPWVGAEQKGFEFPSALDGAVSVGPTEKAPLSGYDNKQIVALPGWEIAGRSQTVARTDFLRGGMKQAEIARRVMRPVLDWNKTVFATALDVISATGKSTGAPVDNGKYVIKDIHGNNVTKTLISDSANECGDVIANASQSILWPLRDGTETAANHDHTVQSAGAAWTLALARTHRDLVTEHVGAGAEVDCYIGKSEAEAIRTVLKSELGAIPDRQRVINMSIATAGGLGDAVLIAEGLEGVNYYYSVDMDVEQALYVGRGKRPFYLSKGALDIEGVDVSRGMWMDPGDNETRVRTFGYGAYQNLGCQNPIASAVIDYV